ncbi:MAG TPA: OmpA family protein [Burkholderiaceae bacterium]|nr:OmpA family protein [Burkholderiaceae bacterium]
MTQAIKKRTLAGFLAALLTPLILAGCAHTPDLIVLDSDVTFAFGEAELTPEGRKQIDMYIPSLASRGEIRLDIVGHTDRIGSHEANMALSKRRADAVRDQIVASGRIDPDQIRTRGVGPRNPVVHCDQQNRAELIKCLAPNRRVEINVTDIRW